MKQFLKSSFSIFLALTIVFGSAIVGLNEIDFSEIKFVNTFAVESKAAGSGFCGANLRWYLDDAGTLTINGTGEMYDYSYYYGAYSPWNQYEELINNIVIDSGVTSIGQYAFYDCDYFVSVTIPDTVTKIGKDAFSSCTGLASVTIPGSVKKIGNSAFSWCKSLASVTICDGMKTIGQDAFQSCTSLTSIVIPDSVTSIEFSAFEACTSLASITIGNGVTDIGKYVFRGCTSLTAVEIGGNVTNINGSAFSGCTSLEAITVAPSNEYYCTIDGVLFNKDATKIIKYPQKRPDSTYIIPDSVTSIGGTAFSACVNLTSVVLPDGVKKIGDSAFSYCNSLVSIELPDTVTSIGDSAFAYCTSLTSIAIPNGLTSIGEQTFSNCTGLKSITIPDSVTSICRYAFSDCSSLESVYIDSIDAWCKMYFAYDTDDGLYFFEYSNPLWYAKNLYIDGVLAKDIVIPDGLTNINPYSFCGYDNLASVTIPDSVKTIGASAFAYCINLTSVKIPNSVTTIEDEAFEGCSGLKAITMGKGVSSIGYDAFYECTALESVYIDNLGAWCYISFERNYDWDYIEDSFGNSNPLYYAKNLYVKGELAKDIVIPDGVEIVNEYAFWGYDISSIRIPVSVKSVRYCAFWCNVGHVYYEGTNEQWKKISFASGNGNLRNATRTKPKCSKPKLKAVTNTEHGALIKWSKVEFADSYRVYRKVKDGKWKYLDTTKNTYFTDKTAKSGTKYYYSVCAKNNEGVSERSSSLLIKRLSVPKLSSVANTSSGIKVSWKKVTGASSYIVYRKTKGGKWDAIKKTSKLYYTDTKAKGGKTYIYTVRACSGSERSYYDTNGLSLRRLRRPEISSAASKREGILIKWNKITGASGYYVYRKTSSGDWKKIATVKGNTKIKYLDETPRKGVTYQYRVKAYYGKSTSYKSNTYKVKSKY